MNKTQHLVGGFKHSLFSKLYGIILPIDSYFSEGWNHQPDIFSYFLTKSLQSNFSELVLLGTCRGHLCKNHGVSTVYPLDHPGLVWDNRIPRKIHWFLTVYSSSKGPNSLGYTPSLVIFSHTQLSITFLVNSLEWCVLFPWKTPCFFPSFFRNFSRWTPPEIASLVRHGAELKRQELHLRGGEGLVP